MRLRARRSELLRFIAPAAAVLDGAWQRVHWWVLTMTILYAGSGITIVHPGEVALVMRWGRVIGPPLEPGPAFLLPYPIDEVVRVPVKRVFEQRIATLSTVPGASPRSPSLDPVTQGYVLTGDRNIVHVEMVARYQIKDPLAWAFYGPSPEAAITAEVTAAMMRSLGELGVDRVLSDGRKELIAMASRRAQSGLDAARAGIELSSLELTRLGPPAALSREFDAVQSAAIDATTKLKTAQGFAARAIPEAQSSAERRAREATGDAEIARAHARGETEAFLELEHGYRENRSVMRERLYRDAIERALVGAEVRWVPPPVGAHYDTFRISVTTGHAGPSSGDDSSGAPTRQDQDEEP